MKDWNSSVNQGIKGDFVSREVHANVNSMVEFILGSENRNAPFSYDDVSNLYRLPEYIGKHANFDGGTEDQRDEEIDRLVELQDTKEAEIKSRIDSEIEAIRNNDIIDDDEKDEQIEELESKFDDEVEEIKDEIQEDIDALVDLESEQQEIYEWWLVSDFLARKLKEKGEPVIEDENIWGRCTCGQAILLDHVISEICSDMEILEGQAHDWSKK
jgi:hypothetical protein